MEWLFLFKRQDITIMTTGTYRFTGMLAIISMTLCLGCAGGNGVDRIDVQGTATFLGAPIAYGEVEFFPDQQAGHVAPAGNAQILDGKFDTAMDGQGIVPGPHKVRVTAYATAPAFIEDETMEYEAIEPLFVGYEMTMDILETPVTIDVPAEADGFNIMEAGEETAGGDEP